MRSTEELLISRGAIVRMKLPAGYEPGEATFGGRGNNWTVPYLLDGQQKVQIILLSRGIPISDVDCTFFRLLLEEEPRLLFQDQKREFRVPEGQKSTVEGLRDVLGNVGNNQITNSEKGLRGPRFQLNQLETTKVSGRAVLVARGWFHTYEMKLDNCYHGLFFDGTPEAEFCQIEEVLFQTDTQELFDEHCQEFYDSLTTIEWK